MMTVPHEEAPLVGRFTLFDLRHRCCRFPMWGPAERSGFYCGDVTVSDLSSWCLKHRDAVFLPVQPGRVR